MKMNNHSNMTTEIEVLKAIYAAINRNDIPAALEMFDPQIVRVEPPGFPMSGTYRGLAKLQAQWSTARATWAEGGCEPEEFAVVGNKIVVFLHVLVKLKNKPDWIDARMADVFEFQNGKVIEMRSFAAKEEALAWAAADGAETN